MRNTSNGSSLEAALTPGQMLGRYELLLPIASGGMGNVWAARLKGTRGFRKLVAIKTILQSFEDEKLEQMLLQEATIASQIHHPNVVETLELGEHEGMMFLAMELIEGESLSFVMREAQKSGGVPLNVSVNLIGQVCRGLAAAHDLRDCDNNPIGLVHRDVSPPNLLVTYSGTVKIVDFGVATTSASATLGSGEIKGKISYLSPEQLRGDGLDSRVDVFATGIVLYQLTVGRHPFKAPTEGQTIGRILSDQRPTPPSAWVPDYPEALEHVVLRALEKDPRNRWGSAAEFLNALDRAMPQAFGPAADRATAEYIGNLLRNRMVERRATLRLAEEETGITPMRLPTSSVPVMVATTPTPAARVRRSRVVYGAIGMALALVVAVAIRGVRHLEPWLGNASAAQVSAQPERQPYEPRIEAATAVGAEMPNAALSIPSSTSASARAVARVEPPRASRPAPERAKREDPVDVPELPSELDGRATPPENTDPVALIDSGIAFFDAGPEVSLSTGLSATAVGAAVPSAPSSRFVSAMVVPKSEPLPKIEAPRNLSSKIAHRRLAIDPRADAFRVRLPPALAHSSRSFAATVRICVSADGRVTSANVTRPAGPAIDEQIPEVLRRWRYTPLVENGVNVPFCYSLRYELAGR